MFTLAASAAASERNFIHSKLRNSLDAEKVRKLVYIKTNMVQMMDRTRTEESRDSDFSGNDEA